MSLFDNLPSQQIISEPFPHIIVHDLLDASLVEELIKKRPSLEHIVGDTPTYPAKKFHFHSASALKDPELEPIWKDLVKEHVQPAVCRKMLQPFKEQIAEQYPELIRRFGSIDEWTIGQRYVDAPEKFTLLADIQFTYHIPVPGELFQERGPHLKISNKIAICIFMLRIPEDKDVGGDIEIYSTVDGQKVTYGRDSEITNPKAIKLHSVVPYQANTALIFVNSPYAITTFAKRANNHIPQMYFNIVLELQEPIFSRFDKFESKKPGFVQKLQRIFSYRR